MTGAGAHPVYAVAGGNHVTVLLGRDETGGELDAIDVLAQPGGGPPAHRHAFAEWFRVLEGELTLCEEREGEVRPTAVLGRGAVMWIAPWKVHATLNLSDAPARFQVVGRPGAMSGYFAEAGIRVADDGTAPASEPPGPKALTEIAARWGIEFWTGVVATPGSRP